MHYNARAKRRAEEARLCSVCSEAAATNVVFICPAAALTEVEGVGAFSRLVPIAPRAYCVRRVT